MQDQPEEPKHRAVVRVTCGCWRKDRAACYIHALARLRMTSADASSALGSTPQLGSQARDLAQLLGHFFKASGRLLSGHFRL